MGLANWTRPSESQRAAAAAAADGVTVAAARAWHAGWNGGWKTDPLTVAGAPGTGIQAVVSVEFTILHFQKV